MTTLSETVAANLKRVCVDQDISTRDLAKRAGIPQKSAWNLLNNQHSPTLATLEPVAKVLGVDFAALVTPGISMKLIQSGKITRLINQFSETSEAIK